MLFWYIFSSFAYLFYYSCVKNPRRYLPVTSAFGTKHLMQFWSLGFPDWTSNFNGVLKTKWKSCVDWVTPLHHPLSSGFWALSIPLASAHDSATCSQPAPPPPTNHQDKTRSGCSRPQLPTPPSAGWDPRGFPSNPVLRRDRGGTLTAFRPIRAPQCGGSRSGWRLCKAGD